VRLLYSSKLQSCRLRQRIPGDANAAFAAQEKNVEDTSTKLTYHNCNSLLHSLNLDSCELELEQSRVCIFENTSSNATLDYGLRTEYGGNKMEADLERRFTAGTVLYTGGYPGYQELVFVIPKKSVRSGLRPSTAPYTLLTVR
jgi:hypothetical protein